MLYQHKRAWRMATASLWLLQVSLQIQKYDIYKTDLKQVNDADRCAVTKAKFFIQPG